MRRFTPAFARALPALALLALVPRGAAADAFWDHWGDGKAELSGYALVEPRYGQPREGTAVMIFVTEDFCDSAHVKADPGRHPPADVYPVLKLNFVRDFQTGIYDYNVLTSVFARADGGPAMPVAKTSFSSQEWCGHVYQQWLARGGKLQGTLHSYFDGEADAQPVLPFPDGGVLEDALPILVRNLRGEWLRPGEARTVPLLPSTLRARFEHRPQAWTEAVVRRSAKAEPVQSALGRVAAYTVTVEEKGGPTTTWTVEDAPPRRILAWRSSSGETGTLLGSARLAYWQLNGKGGEAYLKQLGLAPLPAPKAK